MTKVIRLIIGLTALAAPLTAQRPPQPDSTGHPRMGPGPMSGMMMDDPMMQQMGPAMMKMMLYTPQHLLARKDAVGLTPDQVSRLTVLRDGAKATRDAAMAEAATHVKELEQAADAARPDTAMLKTHFQAAHDAMKSKALDGLKRAFRPEFLNRIDQVVVFRALSREDLRGG